MKDLEKSRDLGTQIKFLLLKLYVGYGAVL
jgi:hypothetical protein